MHIVIIVESSNLDNASDGRDKRGNDCGKCVDNSVFEHEADDDVSEPDQFVVSVVVQVEVHTGDLESHKDDEGQSVEKEVPVGSDGLVLVLEVLHGADVVDSAGLLHVVDVASLQK